MGVVLVEWPDRLGDALPADRLDVHIHGDEEAAAGEPSSDDESRRIRLTAHGSGYERYVEAARAAGAPA